MSFSDIVQFVGTGSVPVIVAGTVYGVFELGEKLASQRAKDALSKWLLSFDVQKAGALPNGTREFFERIFGERHFSLKCFARSAAFSLGAIIFVGMIVILIYPTTFSELKRQLLLPGYEEPYGSWVAMLLWIPLSILADYLSLFKTRVILRLLARIGPERHSLTILLLIADFLVYFILIKAASIAMLLGEQSIQFGRDIVSVVRSFIDVVSLSTFLSIPYEISLYFILFWAGLAPSLWLWLYVLALFVTRALLRSERIVNWLRWGLDVEKAPFRSIGAVAAVLAFIASVAILLVSPEVSRISAAA